MGMVKTSEIVMCIKSCSNYYKVGATYCIYKDRSGGKFTKGADGIFDPVGKTLSKFKPVSLKVTK